MMETTADAEAGNSNRAGVTPQDVVPRKVDFENRTVTDKWWAVAYVLSYIAFISTGSYIASQAHEHELYTYDEDGYRSGIGEHFLEDVQTCCGDQTSGGLCWYLNADDNRRLQERNSKFDGDEGIFDAFLEAPEIIIGLTALAFAIAIVWTFALRLFSKQIVILSELCKVALFVWAGIQLEDTGARIVSFLIAAGLAVYAAWARNKILFAAKVIKHSTIAMKENPSIFIGSGACVVLFALNAALFVFFFSQSFKVTEVQKTSYPTPDGYYPAADSSDSDITADECYYGYPSYVRGIGIYQCISYLWTVLLFEKFRLSIIAAIVGSWHFHPENKASVWDGIKNIGPSFGTLSFSSLITSLAEYMNKLANQKGFCHLCSPAVIITGPLMLMMCVCSGLKLLIQMLTKYAVILHTFTGKPFIGSAKDVFKILSRHFKGGFVTEFTSRSVLNLASYGFSLGIGMLAWKWVDDRFDCGTLVGMDNNVFQSFAYMLLLLFTAWYPVLGIYLIILLDRVLREWAHRADQADVIDPSEAWNHYWIPPLAACFVTCIAMMLFTFFSAIFLDIIDTLFLCFAIDKDNNVADVSNEFESIVKELPTYTTEIESVKSEDENVSVPVAVAVYAHSSAPALAD